MFRFRLAPRQISRRPGSIPPPSGSPSPLKWLGGTGLLVVGVAALGGWLLGHGAGANKPKVDVDGEPIVVAMQQIGQLHTAKFTLHDVMRVSTEGQSDNPVSKLPGVNGLYTWATRNEALLTVDGTVEAGINLSKLSQNDVSQTKLADGTTHWRVHLPPVTIYRANVMPNVEDSKSGLLWRDQNIVPKAQAEAEQMFRAKAEQAGIRKQAQDGAIAQLQKMQTAMGRPNVEFYF